MTRTPDRASDAGGATVGSCLAVIDHAQAHDDRLRTDRAVADGGEEVIDRSIVELPGDLEDLVLADGRDVGPREAAQLAFERFAAVDDVLVAVLALEPLADLLASVGGRTTFSQSRDGPCSPLVVTISTMSPFLSR